jgi:hypothetical protein
MCEPLSASTMFYTSLALSAAQAGMSYMAQQDAADAQEAQNLANAEAANRAFIEEAAGQNQQLVEQEIQSSQEVQAVQKEALQKTGALVANSESMGVTFDLLLGDYQRQEAGYRDASNHQMELNNIQAQQNIKGFRAKAIDRGNSGRTPVRPSLLGAVAQVGGSAISSYDAFATEYYEKGTNIKKYTL